jgi:hypothetical protein
MNEENLGIDGRIILNQSKKQDERMWSGFIWLRTGEQWQAPVNMEMNLWVP